MKRLAKTLAALLPKRHIHYRAKKDEAVRHYILKERVGKTDKGHDQVLVFDVDELTQNPIGEPKFRELIPERIERSELKW